MPTKESPCSSRRGVVHQGLVPAAFAAGGGPPPGWGTPGPAGGRPPATGRLSRSSTAETPHGFALHQLLDHGLGGRTGSWPGRPWKNWRRRRLCGSAPPRAGPAFPPHRGLTITGKRPGSCPWGQGNSSGTGTPKDRASSPTKRLSLAWSSTEGDETRKLAQSDSSCPWAERACKVAAGDGEDHRGGPPGTGRPCAATPCTEGRCWNRAAGASGGRTGSGKGEEDPASILFGVQGGHRVPGPAQGFHRGQGGPGTLCLSPGWWVCPPWRCLLSL